MTVNHAPGDPAAARKPQPDRPAWRQTLVAIPAAVLPLLPSFSCPVCLAAYAGVLSSLGLGFVFTPQVQRPLIVFFLTVTLASVAWATRQHKKLGPLMLVLPGSLVIVLARLVWSIPWVLYVGVSCLVAGAVWNLILKFNKRTAVVQSEELAP